MPDILHNVAIHAEPEVVYRSVAEIDGLSRWWTETTSGESAVGKRIDFRFGGHLTGMRVEALKPGERVEWQCVESAPDWVGTRLSFELEASGERTVVRFGHRGWTEAGDFFAHCSMKWATFLLSLKSYAETGQGRPFPNDVPI